MLTCINSEGRVALATKRTLRTTEAILLHRGVRRHKIFKNNEFDKIYKPTGIPASSTADIWLVSQLQMTDRVKKELEMIIAIKKNKVVGKYEEEPLAQEGVDLYNGPEDLEGLKIGKLTSLYNACQAKDDKVKKLDPTSAASDAWAAMLEFEPKVKSDSKKTIKRFDKDAVITILVSENPKKAGSASAARFDFYKNGITIAKALSLGVRSADISYDVKHNFISID